jgi:hypothetical protein
LDTSASFDDAGRHLKQERLEQIVVGAIDDGDPHREALQRPGRSHAGEASTQQ